MENAAAEEPVEDEEVMTDADFERAMEQLREEGGEDVNELLMAMNENQIISWEEAERILGNTSNEPVKSSLPQQTRPTEPDNDTDVDYCVQRLQNNDPKLVEINLNNMKRTPIPKIKRVIEACRDNEYMEKLSLANMGLYDMDVQPLIDILEHNTALRCVNLETNYLSGDFFARLFKAALANQTLEEVKAVNQGVAFSTSAEREIIEAISQNRGLTKVSINLRLPEGRFKIEKATIRNQEIRRILRRQEAQAEVEAKAKGPPKLTTRPPKDEKDEAANKKKTGERKTSGVQELARKTTPSKLAVAGALAQLRADKSEKPTTTAEKPVLKEKARDMELEAAKPKEPRPTAERLLLMERLRESGAAETGVAARRAKFGEKAEKAAPPAKAEKETPLAAEKAAVKKMEKEEKPMPAAAAAVDGTSSKPKYVPSWREKLAERDGKAKDLAVAVASAPKSPEQPKAKTSTASSNSTTASKTTKPPTKSPPKSPTKAADRKESKDSTGTTATTEKTTTKRVAKKKKEEDTTPTTDGADRTPKSAANDEKAPVKTAAPSWRDRMNAQKK